MVGTDGLSDSARMRPQQFCRIPECVFVICVPCAVAPECVSLSVRVSVCVCVWLSKSGCGGALGHIIMMVAESEWVCTASPAPAPQLISSLRDNEWSKLGRRQRAPPPSPTPPSKMTFQSLLRQT